MINLRMALRPALEDDHEFRGDFTSVGDEPFDFEVSSSKNVSLEGRFSRRRHTTVGISQVTLESERTGFWVLLFAAVAAAAAMVAKMLGWLGGGGSSGGGGGGGGSGTSAVAVVSNRIEAVDKVQSRTYEAWRLLLGPGSKYKDVINKDPHIHRDFRAGVLKGPWNESIEMMSESNDPVSKAIKTAVSHTSILKNEYVSMCSTLAGMLSSWERAFKHANNSTSDNTDAWTGLSESGDRLLEIAGPLSEAPQLEESNELRNKYLNKTPDISDSAFVAWVGKLLDNLDDRALNEMRADIERLNESTTRIAASVKQREKDSQDLEDNFARHAANLPDGTNSSAGASEKSAYAEAQRKTKEGMKLAIKVERNCLSSLVSLVHHYKKRLDLFIHAREALHRLVTELLRTADSSTRPELMDIQQLTAK